MSDKYPPGRRVFLCTSPWPERRGCHATVVQYLPSGTYPQPAHWERVLLIDDDPLEQPGDKERGWSVVVSVKHLVPRSLPERAAASEGTSDKEAPEHD